MKETNRSAKWVYWIVGTVLLFGVLHMAEVVESWWQMAVVLVAFGAALVALRETLRRHFRA